MQPKRTVADESMMRIERSLWDIGYVRVLGMDEVGRGSLAGPVCVGGVILPPHVTAPGGIRDSKTLSAARRQALSPAIVSASIAHSVACRDSAFVDRHGINAAIQDCQHEIISALKPDYLLLDGFSLPGSPLPQQAITRGDSKSVSIAAASILAKVHRDGLMTAICPVFPQYAFSQNKGYGSKAHISSIREFGPCAEHRLSFLRGVMTHASQ